MFTICIDTILATACVKKAEKLLSSDGKIEVWERGHDYKANYVGEPGKWDCGPTPGQAISRLKITWPT